MPYNIILSDINGALLTRSSCCVDAADALCQPYGGERCRGGICHFLKKVHMTV